MLKKNAVSQHGNMQNILLYESQGMRVMPSFSATSCFKNSNALLWSSERIITDSMVTGNVKPRWSPCRGTDLSWKCKYLMHHHSSILIHPESGHGVSKKHCWASWRISGESPQVSSIQHLNHSWSFYAHLKREPDKFMPHGLQKQAVQHEKRESWADFYCML